MLSHLTDPRISPNLKICLNCEHRLARVLVADDGEGGSMWWHWGLCPKCNNKYLLECGRGLPPMDAAEWTALEETE